MDRQPDKRRVVVVGAGIAGLTAALSLAEQGISITLIERSDISGGILPLLDSQFPNNHCGMCRLLPMIDQEGSQDFCLKRGVFHDNIRFIPCCELASVKGNPGNLVVAVKPVQGAAVAEPEEPEILKGILAVILAGGGRLYDPSDQLLYNMGNLKNVVTALTFEALAAGSPRYRESIHRPSDGGPAQSIAWIQCVGSRNLQEGSPHCASACCMFAVKEAVLAKKLTRGRADTAIFYMDMRSFGRDFQNYRDHAETGLGVRFVRCRVHSIEAAENGEDVEISYVDASGMRQVETFSMAVLSTGKSVSEEEETLWRQFESVEGVRLLKSAREFRDISEAVKGAQAAVCEVNAFLKEVLPGAEDGSLETGPPYAKALDSKVITQKAKLLIVLVRQAGNLCNVAWEAVADRAADTFDADVEIVDAVDAKALERLHGIIREREINRLLIAAENPSVTLPGKKNLKEKLGLPPAFSAFADLTPYFPESGANDGHQTFILSMIRNALVFLNRARLYPETGRKTVQTALIIGSGPAGLAAAKAVSDAGHKAVIVEKSSRIGGNIPNIGGAAVSKVLDALITDVEGDSNIELLPGYSLTEHYGLAGDFRAVAVPSESGDPRMIPHGAVVLATGGGLQQPTSYGYGKDDRVITLQAFRKRVDTPDTDFSSLSAVALILCADSRQEPLNYCSRVCCKSSLETVVELKKQHPQVKIFIFYRDIMTYGTSEALYTEARSLGIFFVQYDPDKKPEVTFSPDSLTLKARDSFSGFDMALELDFLCLAPGLLPGSGDKMAELFGLALTPEGFIKEADYKWRPVDTGREGIYTAGLARAPGRVDEILEDGRAAAARALRLLAREMLTASPVAAMVKDARCSRCGICIDVCPYGARIHSLTDDRVMVDSAACQGCGSCAVACPNSATVISCFEDQAIGDALETAL